MAQLDEIAPDIFRIAVHAPAINLAFCHFLVRDDEPVLVHAGLNGMFADLRATVARLIDPATLRFVAFSHFESDECGALNQWLALAPHAVPLCGPVAAAVNVDDFALRPARALAPDAELSTGRHRFSLLSTPHLPHGWDAGLLFEATGRTLFCSDLFAQAGECPALSTGGVVERARDTLIANEAGPFAHATPYTAETDRQFDRLAALAPRTLAVMHGASFAGDGARALREMAAATRAVLGPAGEAAQGASPA